MLSAYSTQKGVGLIEVLVALILLAIAVLGYVALQTKAISASHEAILKTQAQSVMKGLAENIRTNNASRLLYMNAVNHFLSSSAKPKDCETLECTSAELANFDAYSAKKYATTFGLNIGIADCPGMKSGSTFIRQCIFSSWGDTALTASSGVLDYSKCMSASTGAYVAKANCLMMEMY